ncbi:MAG: hypothetical protein KF817_03025 [Phycisphaeraceae bacterium]|nr:hypothetical protein [Phycisphaeraceae bacterium]
MSGGNERPHAIRVRVTDGKPRKYGVLRNALKPLAKGVFPQGGTKGAGALEFVIDAGSAVELDQVRARLASVRLEEIAAVTEVSKPPKQIKGAGAPGRYRQGHHQGGHRSSPSRPSASFGPLKLEKKPYGFIALPGEFVEREPVWHDGSMSAGRHSGEIRFELKTLTPMLVGCERVKLDGSGSDFGPACEWRQPDAATIRSLLATAARQVYPDSTKSDPERRNREQRDLERDRARYEQDDGRRKQICEVKNGVGLTRRDKSVLGPLRAPWGDRPVLIPADSIKGLLRHELGALLGAPMERVAERSYSYRPNSMYPDAENRRVLEPRLARVLPGKVENRAVPDLAPPLLACVPLEIELVGAMLDYRKRPPPPKLDYVFSHGAGGREPGDSNYRGGQGAGDQLNARRGVYQRLDLNVEPNTHRATVPEPAIATYLRTIRHLVDMDDGHFSSRHPDRSRGADKLVEWAERIRIAAAQVVFQPGDYIFVEWDTEKEEIVSFGWHYYYRWAYQDTVRHKSLGTGNRPGLFPTSAELAALADSPEKLTAVRRLFGYTGDNDGSRGIGKDNFSQLMGRVAPNTAVEIVGRNESENDRFERPTFLKELGLPRPSAVEHYIRQPADPTAHRRDRAPLVTYGDAAGRDSPGELAGRKFYFDRCTTDWADDSEANRLNERSALALEASKPGRMFRFTVRFRDLDTDELAALLVAFCPNQFCDILGGSHEGGYCSKLGSARPLGWGSVRIEAQSLHLLDTTSNPPALTPCDPKSWFKGAAVDRSRWHTAEWLAIHRRGHPEAAAYPTGADGRIYSYHTTLRADHSRSRRYGAGARP